MKSILISLYESKFFKNMFKMGIPGELKRFKNINKANRAFKNKNFIIKKRGDGNV